MLIRKGKDVTKDESAVTAARFARRSSGFTVVELLVVLAIGITLTAVAIPLMSSAMNSMHVNSMVDAISGAVSKTRYQSIMASQPYTLAITAPSNTYVVTNVTTGTANPTVALPSSTVLINGGTSATYTLLFCPNGTVWGAGAACPGTAVPFAISVSSQGRQVNINVSSVGNVTTTKVQ